MQPGLQKSRFENSKRGYQLLPSFEVTKNNDTEYSENESFAPRNVKMDQNELSAYHVELPCKSIYGIVLSFISCCFLATGSLLVKLCQGSLDSYQIALIRSLVQLLFCIPTIAYYRLVNSVALVPNPRCKRFAASTPPFEQ